MDNTALANAISAIASGEYSKEDVKTVKNRIRTIEKAEGDVKKKMDKAKNNYVRAKEKALAELKQLKAKSKSLRRIIEGVA